MIGSLSSKVGVNIASVARPSEAKKSENVENVQDKKESKASKIAEQIANGTYKIDMSKTAKAVAYTLL